MHRFRTLTALWLLIIPSIATSNTIDGTRAFLRHHCLTCHGGEKPKGKLSLTSIDEITTDNATLWQNILTQLASGEMPPDSRPRPKLTEREDIIGWIVQGLTKIGVDPQLPGGPLPDSGNLIDHDRLFSGKFHGPAHSPPRFWRKSQPQYDALMEQFWVIPKLRYEKAHTRTDAKWAAYSYSRPFPSLDPERFTNYSGSVHADEATLKALMNAGWQIAQRLTSEKPAYDKFTQPPHEFGIPSIRRGSFWEKFKVKPPARPTEFGPFLKKNNEPSNEEQQALIKRLFLLLLKREPTSKEITRYGQLLTKSMKKAGPLTALRGLITAVVVSPEFVYRMEVGMGPEDKHGRRMLSSKELVYAIAYALSDDGPDEKLWNAAHLGKLKTKADVEREVRRILADSSIEKHRKLRFFQEFFGYHRAIDIFKDKQAWKLQVQYLIRDADLLVEYVLNKDRNVLAELLTTDRYFVAYPAIKDPKLFDAIIENTKKETLAGIEKSKARGRKIGPARNGRYSRAWNLLQGNELIPRTVHNDRSAHETSYISIYGFDGNDFNWTREQPIKVPGRRAGILTHPAWLVSHSTNFDNDIVRRGRWIREHLLAGTIPDVPLDVEAQVPDEPNETLRHRMRVTRATRCIRCHRRMDPLGYPFEMYDHYGQYRTQEMVGTRKRKGVPVDASGAILSSGEESLNGEVKDAIELVHRLAKSKRVRQSFVRHAFRYWMGRNEMLSDAPTIIAANKAYADNQGSFNEMLIALLTSDSFLYRK